MTSMPNPFTEPPAPVVMPTLPSALPNPFVFSAAAPIEAQPHPFSAVNVPSSAEETPAATEHAVAADAVVAGNQGSYQARYQARRFKPDLDRLYEDIVGHADVPLFLRRPSPAFMRALFQLAEGR